MRVPSAPERRRRDTRRLRPDVRIRRTSDDALELEDPITHRSFRFAGLQVEVVTALDGHHSARAIAGAVLGDEEKEEEIQTFLHRLGQLGLLDRYGPAEGLAERQARALRETTRRRTDARVRESVRWAAAKLPFYRKRLAGCAQKVRGVRDLELLPTTSKSDLRAGFPRQFLAEGADLGDLLARGEARVQATSGSTGGRLEYLYDTDRDAFFPRHPGGAPIPGGWNEARIARFSTPHCNGAVCHMGGLPYEERLIDSQYLFLDSSERIFQLGRDEVDATARDLERFQPNVLMVDPVYAVNLVRAFERFGRPLPPVASVMSGFEYCSILHRPIIERAFAAPLTDLLAATDLGGGTAAFTCERGRFHVNQPEYVFEFVRGGRPAEPGEIGEVHVTSLNHRFTRLVRYRVGDLASPAPDCGCAFDDWTSFHFEGRLQDCLISTAGKPVTTRAVDQLFAGLAWIDFYQLVQRGAGEYVLLAVRRDGASRPDDERDFLDRARELLGSDAAIRVQYARELPGETSFKFPLTRRTIAAPWKEW